MYFRVGRAFEPGNYVRGCNKTTKATFEHRRTYMTHPAEGSLHVRTITVRDSESIGLTIAEALIRETLNCVDVLQQAFVKANVSFRIGRFARLSSDSEASFQFSLRCSSVEIAKMSSPSPGKRRMDTDVVKLYPLPI